VVVDSRDCALERIAEHIGPFEASKLCMFLVLPSIEHSDGITRRRLQKIETTSCYEHVNICDVADRDQVGLGSWYTRTVHVS